MYQYDMKKKSKKKLNVRKYKKFYKTSFIINYKWLKKII